MSLTPREEARLPLYARRELERLRGDLHDLMEDVRAFADPDSRVRLIRLMDRIGLPSDGAVEFVFDEYHAVQVRLLTEDEGGPMLVIHCTGNRLDIEPRAANAVHLRVRRN